MSTILNFSGYAAIILAVIAGVGIMADDSIETMKWALVAGTMLSGILLGGSAVLIARIYNGTVADKYDNSDFTRKRQAEASRNLY